MSEDYQWYAPKRFGIGAGLPIAWQGWAILVGYIALVTACATLLGKNDIRTLAIVIPATILLLIVTARTTRGGWRWRWGEDE